MDIIVKVPKPPGRDQKVDGTRKAQTPGGMAANVAVGTSRLGTPTRLLGAVGDDAMGREALDALGREALDLEYVATRRGAATFFCIIMVDDDGEKSLVKVVSPAYLPRLEDLTDAAFDQIGHVHLTFTRHDLAMRAIELARASGASVSLDLEAADVPTDGGQIAELVEAVDLLFISDQSRTHVEGVIGPLYASPALTLVTTQGAAGARAENGSVVISQKGYPVDVTDTSGAGDAFAAGFLHARLSGADDRTALRFANAAAAISTRAYGAQNGLAMLSEVENFLKHRISERSDA
jgi:ribokinase